MSERKDALEAAFITLEQRLSALENHVEALEHIHNELREDLRSADPIIAKAIRARKA